MKCAIFESRVLIIKILTMSLTNVERLIATRNEQGTNLWVQWPIPARPL